MTTGPDQVRAEGPYVVVDGDPDRRGIVVLDPAGAAKHEELPATWRPIADRRRIFWCRLPTDGALTEAEELLTNPPAPVDLVAGGTFADAALNLAAAHTGTVRAVLLVDPGTGTTDADQEWARRAAGQWQELETAGVRVQVIAHSTGGKYDRVPPPLPLGHPDVVAGAQRAFDELDDRA
ncbi:hypothetical protein [Amycolatopsis nigrescens]|uniref:hypothetical protein n=1 Tax=Amycolatopsis nigrescens TaxID=381445 RepID=UPI0003721477|nr:hypothetical protein [Amycolatopsis nigrescens]